MSVVEEDIKTIADEAYQSAWSSVYAYHHLSEIERQKCPDRLKDYIDILIASGERNPAKIAATALGLIREYAQIARSQATLGDTGIVP